VPRWLTSVKDDMLSYLVLREIYLAGSLTKHEIVRSIVDLKRNQRVKKFTVSEAERQIDEMTLNHQLIGVSA
jgi:hypothetical protein